MTTATMGWFVAGICVCAFLALWLVVSYRELAAKRRNLDAIREQVDYHRKLCMQERGGELDPAAQNILENKIIVCRELEKDYRRTLRNPFYGIPGCLMGFRRGEKDGVP